VLEVKLVNAIIALQQPTDVGSGSGSTINVALNATEALIEHIAVHINGEDVPKEQRQENSDKMHAVLNDWCATMGDQDGCEDMVTRMKAVVNAESRSEGSEAITATDELHEDETEDSSSGSSVSAIAGAASAVALIAVLAVGAVLMKKRNNQPNDRDIESAEKPDFQSFEFQGPATTGSLKSTQSSIQSEVDMYEMPSTTASLAGSLKSGARIEPPGSAEPGLYEEPDLGLYATPDLYATAAEVDVARDSDSMGETPVVTAVIVSDGTEEAMADGALYETASASHAHDYRDPNAQNNDMYATACGFETGTATYDTATMRTAPELASNGGADTYDIADNALDQEAIYDTASDDVEANAATYTLAAGDAVATYTLAAGDAVAKGEQTYDTLNVRESYDWKRSNSMA
jgi:hypothetical protein